MYIPFDVIILIIEHLDFNTLRSVLVASKMLNCAARLLLQQRKQNGIVPLFRDIKYNAEYACRCEDVAEDYYSGNEHLQNMFKLSYIYCVNCENRTLYSDLYNSQDDSVTFICESCSCVYNGCYDCCTKQEYDGYIRLSYICSGYAFCPNDCELKKCTCLNLERLERRTSDRYLYMGCDNFIEYESMYQTFPQLVLEESDDDNNPISVIYTKKIRCHDEKQYGPITGPDGGYTTNWWCEGCKKVYMYSDK